jgi:preprotein translocase subunit YajC
MLLTLLESTATTAKQPSGLFWVIYIVILVGFMWLLIIRPQKKQKKQMEDLHKAMEPGDNIMTTGGFYGTILDIVDDTTVTLAIEFTKNKHDYDVKNDQVLKAKQYLNETSWIWEKFNRNVIVLKDLTEEEFKIMKSHNDSAHSLSLRVLIDSQHKLLSGQETFLWPSNFCSF